MKTTGERIRQAREALGWSGQKLATKAGYRHQSAIGNLESRATGHGGNRVSAIADALGVSVEWLVRGPDSEQVPFLDPSIIKPHAYEKSEATAHLVKEADNVVSMTPPEHDKLTVMVLDIFAKLNQSQKAAAVALLQQYQLVIGTQHDGQAL